MDTRFFFFLSSQSPQINIVLRIRFILFFPFPFPSKRKENQLLSESLAHFHPSSYYLILFDKITSQVNDQLVEHPQNVYYTQVINLSKDLLMSYAHGESDGEDDNKDAESGGVSGMSGGAKKIAMGKKLDIWIKLQENVNYLVDNKNAPISMKAPPGIKQLLEVCGLVWSVFFCWWLTFWMPPFRKKKGYFEET